MDNSEGQGQGHSHYDSEYLWYSDKEHITVADKQEITCAISIGLALFSSI